MAKKEENEKETETLTNGASDKELKTSISTGKLGEILRTTIIL